MPRRLSATVLTASALLVIPALILLTGPLAPADVNQALAITILSIGLWATGLLPEHLTALIFFTLIMLFGVAPASVAFAGFASSALWMIFAGLVIGAAMEHCGLARRLARGLAAGLGRSYGSLVSGVIVFEFLLSFLMPSAMGRVVLSMPIIVAVADRYGFVRGSRGRTGLLLAAAFGAFLPAFGIMPSNVPNMVLTGAAEALYHVTPTYGAWLVLHFPILGVVKALLLGALVTGWFRDTPQPPAVLEAAEPWTRAERQLAVLLALCLALWATDFLHHVNAAWIGLVMAILCLFPGSGLLPERAFPSRINLAPLFYVAGIISLGAVVSHTGLGAQAAATLLGLVPLGPDAPAWTFASLSLSAAVIGLFTTLPGIPAVLTPSAGALADAAGLPLMTVLMTEVLGFSTVILPYQSPPLMVALRLGEVSMAAASKLCLVLAALTVTLLLPLDYLWWRLLGWL